jgi:heme-degrading monooxygenase HmoA
MVVASFHLARFGTLDAARVMARVPLDRRALRHGTGLRFARLLGTGRDTRMTTSADLRRWAVFAVWESRADLEAGRRLHPVLQRWDDRATERYDLTLEPLGAKGTWGGVDPIAGAATATPDRGPLAVLTRATVRWRRLPAFLASVPPVEDTLRDTDGLLARLGIGEVPVGRQATFSLWRDADAVRAFTHRDPRHAEVVQRTREDGWYAEEWFARFRPVERSGTWGGRDPLDAVTH